MLVTMNLINGCSISKNLTTNEKILKRVIKYNNQEWLMITKKYARPIMNYDPDNYQKKKIQNLSYKVFS